MVALVAACGSSGDDGQTAPPTSTLVVRALEEPLLAADAPSPLSDVTIALDPPGGGPRQERATDADGRVSFQGDFARGGVNVTAFSRDHTLVTKLDVSSGPEVVIVLPRLDRAIRDASIALRGTLSGRAQLKSTVDLSASALARLGSVQTTDVSYSLRAPRDHAFFVLGHELRPGTELVQSFRRDLPASSSDVVLDIDLSAVPKLPTRAVHVRAIGAGSRASATVVSAESELLLAPFVRSQATSDGRGFDIEMAVADTDIAPEHPLTRVVLSRDDGSRSVRHELGVAADGAAFDDFLPPPTVADASRSILDPIPLDGVPPGADLRVELVAGGSLFWILEGPRGGLRQRELRLPEPVGITFSADVQIFALALIARTDRIESLVNGEIYRHVSVSRDVPVRRR